MSASVTPATVSGAYEIPEVDAPSPAALWRRRALGHAGLLAGGTVVAMVVLAALCAPLVAPFDPYQQDLARRLVAPVWGEGGSWTHPFGTDALGRDVLSRLIHGARISLAVGFFPAAIAAIVGTTLGIAGGYFGGRVDAFVMYLVNVKLALPPLLIALSLVSVVGGSLTALILILGFLFWDRVAIVTRTATQQLRSQEFVAAAHAVGASRLRILFGELLPNVMDQIIVIFTLEMALAILIEAALSFLGLGIRPPTPSWGLMISEGRSFIFFKPYLIMLPGAAIFLLVLAINMAGDGVRDVTAPQSRS